ncbi:hypothetical protein DSCW_35550 [Desulfosarcina widdelii]|uniref:HTH cro/C1-type domain-containing protein n=1 Tax=Desulfosarcina widdelii TaxID=947919 RepID=A0A5K7Z556_9BACT|nr:helix-turn-helix transcriptional regulator [Desulfosarcina widdelii]BBO76138.1 hypothetical protein DSCW_35550 [Desulfosarcina widdelii]
MDTESWFKSKRKSIQKTLDYKIESLLLSITETLREQLKNEGMTRSMLAKKLGVSPAAVTKLLNGESNFTIKKLMSLADALNLEVQINLERKQIKVEHVVGDFFGTVVSASDDNSLVCVTGLTPGTEFQGTYSTVSSGFAQAFDFIEG